MQIFDNDAAGEYFRPVVLLSFLKCLRSVVAARVRPRAPIPQAVAAAGASKIAKKTAAAALAATTLPSGGVQQRRQIGRYMQWAEFRGGVVNALGAEAFARCNATLVRMTMMFAVLIIFPAGVCRRIAGRLPRSVLRSS